MKLSKSIHRIDYDTIHRIRLLEGVYHFKEIFASFPGENFKNFLEMLARHVSP
jgi:hypothetical protein